MLANIAFVAIMVVPCIGLYFLRRAHHRRQHAAELRAPLLPNEAGEGFNACKVCGFENFKRFPFCNVCGDKILEHESAQQLSKKKKKTLAWGSKKSSKKSEYEGVSAKISASIPVEPTQRQQRARKRKEWTRKIGADGALFWYRDGSTGADLRFAGCVLLFKESSSSSTGAVALEEKNQSANTVEDQDTDVVVMEAEFRREPNTDDAEFTTCTDEPDQEPTREEAIDDAGSVPTSPQVLPQAGPASKHERAEELELMFTSLRLQVVDASTANPALLPLENASDANLQWRDVLSLSQQTFPVKYAHFVTITASLIVPSEREILKLNLSREHLFEDSIESLTIIPAKNIRSGMRINFVGEAGVDAGGLHREWFVLLNESFVDPSCGVFRCLNKDEQTFFLSANSKHDLGKDHLVYYYSAGRFIGRALLEGYAMGFHLSFPLIKIILGLPVTFSDLEYFDPEAYRGLLWLVENEGVDALGLDFSVTEKRGEEIVVIDLVPNGRNIDVTDDNKHEYLRCRVQFTLFESVSSQLYVFLKGLYEVIPQELLMLFDPEEFDYLLCGSDEIDVDDWEKHTKYTPELHEHRALIWFWEIVREMPNEYRRRLLHFATGSSRVPIAGFSGLTSYDGKLCPFTLKGVLLKDDGYIWSHACFNRLDLPLHVIREELKAVMYAAVETDTYGFTTT